MSSSVNDGEQSSVNDGERVSRRPRRRPRYLVLVPGKLLVMASSSDPVPVAAVSLADTSNVRVPSVVVVVVREPIRDARGFRGIQAVLVRHGVARRG